MSAAVRFGPFRLDRHKRVLWRNDALVALPPKAVDLLSALVDSAGDLVSKNELMERLWPETFVEEANLSVTVSVLRKALGGDYIQTVPRRGYRFVGPITAEAPAVPSLAVLPFKHLSPRPGDEHLGVGLADALITRLSRLGPLVLRPTSAVLRYAAPGTDPREAGRALRVDAVVDGTLQRDADRVRLTVQLVDVEKGETRWADSFETAFTGLFELEDTVAARVVEALAPQLAAQAKTRPAPPSTSNPVAREAYLKGRYFWARFTGPWLGRAVACFQEAVEADPEFALPHSGLADAFLILGFTGIVPPRDAWEAAEAAARRALTLDETVAEAHVSLGYTALFRAWDWVTAERELRRALSLSPHTASAHQWYGLLLDMMGRLDEAQVEIDRARELDPVSVVGSAISGFQAYLAHDRDQEAAAHRTTLELDPNHFLGHWGLGLLHQTQGRFEAAVACHTTAAGLAGDAALLKPVLARSLALAERRDEARALLVEMEAMEPEVVVSHYQRATVHAALGESGAALESLRRAVEARDPWVVWLRVDPMLADLRATDGFATLERKVFPRT